MLLDQDRIDNFQNILAEEVDEASEISAKYKDFLAKDGGGFQPNLK